jgi:hypothetical protein
VPESSGQKSVANVSGEIDAFVSNVEKYYQRFGEVCCLYPQGRKYTSVSEEPAASVFRVLVLPTFCKDLILLTSRLKS